MYRDRYPYIKMTLPPVEANPIEEKAWENAISKIKNINKIYNRNNMNIKVTDISDSNLSLNENSNPKNIADKESLNEPISNSPEQNEELHSKLVATVTELVNNLSPLRNNGVIQLTQISIEFLALEDLEMKIAYLVGNLDINISIEVNKLIYHKIIKHTKYTYIIKFYIYYYKNYLFIILIILII